MGIKIKQIYGLQDDLNNKFDSSGGTISGDTNIIGSIDATTIYSGGTDIYDIFKSNSGKSISKLFEGVFTQPRESFKVTNTPKDVPFDTVTIKDDYYSHSATTSSIGSEVTILNDGWYEFNITAMVKSDNASGGLRGNPIINIWFDNGSGWVEDNNQPGGYIREDDVINISTTITTIGLYNLSSGTKFKITIRDSANTPPNESLVGYTTKLIIKYIDRTSSISGSTIENLKDIGDVLASAPGDKNVLTFNGNTSKWDSLPPEKVFISGGTLVEVTTGSTGIITVKSLYPNITSEPTGFSTLETSDFGFDDSTRTLTISAKTTTFNFYIKGDEFTKVSESYTIPDLEGEHFIYFNSNGVLTGTTVFDLPLVYENALVGIIYWDKTNQKHLYLGEERHGASMPGVVHAYLHLSVGTAYMNGLMLANFNAIGSGNDDSSAQFSCSDGEIWDEDIRIFIKNNAPTTLSPILEAPLFYMEGNTETWRRKEPSKFLIKNATSATGRAMYNKNVGGVWSTEEVNEHDFLLTHIFATNDKETPIFAIMGQNQYPTNKTARAGANVEMSNLITIGIPTAEFIPVATIIFQTDKDWNNQVKSRVFTTDTGENYINWIGSDLSPTSTPGSHSNLSDLNVDDHPQYALLSGRSGDTLNIETISAETISATTFYGDGSYLTGISGGTSIDNFVYVTKLSDFPTPQLKKITLLDNVIYEINGNVNIEDNYLQMGEKSILKSVSPFNSSLTYSGSTGSMIRSSNVTISIRNIKLISKNDKIFDCHGNSGTTFTNNFTIFENSDDIGVIDGFSTINLDYNNYINNNSGLKISNFNELIYTRQYFNEFSCGNSLTGNTLLSISGNSINSIRLDGNIFYTKSGDISVNIDSNIILESGTISNNNFTGLGSHIDGTNILNTPKWRFIANTGIDNHHILPILSDTQITGFTTPPNGILVANSTRNGLSLYHDNKWIHFTGITSTVSGLLWSSSFESGDFGTDNWVTVDSTQSGEINFWSVGSDTKSVGSYGAYISDNATNHQGGTATYTNTDGNININHLYKQVTIPSGSFSNMKITFDWKCEGESGYDWGSVSFVPNTSDIVADTAISSIYNIGDYNGDGTIGHYNNNSTFEGEELNEAISGGEVGYLVFSFRCDVDETNPPFCVDNVKVYYE